LKDEFSLKTRRDPQIDTSSSDWESSIADSKQPYTTDSQRWWWWTMTLSNATMFHLEV